MPPNPPTHRPVPPGTRPGWDTLPVVQALRSRWPLGAGVMAAVALAVATAGFLQTPQYAATARALVDVRPDPLAPAGAGAMSLSSTMATQADVARSERVLQQAAQALALAGSAPWRERWQRETAGQVPLERWLVHALQDEISVRPARDSSVLLVTATAADAEAAAALANGVLSAYLDTTVALRVEPAQQYSRFFEGRLQEARAALERAQQRHSAHLREHDIVSLDERFDVENTRLNEMSSQLTALQAALAEAAGRQAAAQGRQAERLQEVMNHPALAQIAADLARNQGQLQQLATRLGDNHPQVLELRAQQQELRSRQEDETRRVAGSVGLSGALTRQREADLRTALGAQRERVLRLKAVRDDGQVLQREVEQAQRAFDAVQQRLTQSQLESRATQALAQVLSPALPPLSPDSPRLPLLVALGLVLGATLGLGACVLAGPRPDKGAGRGTRGPGDGAPSVLEVVHGSGSKAA